MEFFFYHLETPKENLANAYPKRNFPQKIEREQQHVNGGDYQVCQYHIINFLATTLE